MQDNARRYATWAGTVPANDRVDINTAGHFFRLLTGNTGLQVRIDDEPPGIFPVGVGISCPEPFKRLTVINSTGAPIAVEVAIGRGAIDDARLSVSGVVDVRDPVDASSFSDVLAGLLAELRDADSKRAALNTLAGATMTSGQSTAAGATTILAPGGNANGAIIRVACLSSENGGEQAICVKGATPASVHDGAILTNEVLRDAVLPQPLFIPAGLGVYRYIGTGGATHRFTVWYEVL